MPASSAQIGRQSQRAAQRTRSSYSSPHRSISKGQERPPLKNPSSLTSDSFPDGEEPPIIKVSDGRPIHCIPTL